jgi:hypothetical protein
MLILAFACLGFLIASTLVELYVYMFLFGASFPGRMITGQNFAYEF